MLGFMHLNNAYFGLKCKEKSQISVNWQIVEEKFKISFLDGVKNMIRALSSNPKSSTSELQRDIFHGVPLEYEVLDKEESEAVE